MSNISTGAEVNYAYIEKLLKNYYILLYTRCGKKFMAFFPLDGIKNVTNFFSHLIFTYILQNTAYNKYAYNSTKMFYIELKRFWKILYIFIYRYFVQIIPIKGKKYVALQLNVWILKLILSDLLLIFISLTKKLIIAKLQTVL